MKKTFFLFCIGFTLVACTPQESFYTLKELKADKVLRDKIFKQCTDDGRSSDTCEIANRAYAYCLQWPKDCNSVSK